MNASECASCPAAAAAAGAQLWASAGELGLGGKSLPQRVVRDGVRARDGP